LADKQKTASLSISPHRYIVLSSFKRPLKKDNSELEQHSIFKYHSPYLGLDVFKIKNRLWRSKQNLIGLLFPLLKVIFVY